MSKLTKEDLEELNIVEEVIDEVKVPEKVLEIQKLGVELDEYSAKEINVVVYAKVPTRKLVQYFVDKVQDKTASFMETQKTFVKSSIVYPEAEELAKIEEEYPAIYLSLSTAILDRAGLVTFTRKKLLPIGN